jgi:hypothetical protein
MTIRSATLPSHVCGPQTSRPTLAMLDGRDGLGAGLGLGAFKLIRLPMEESAMELGRPAPVTALGREGFRKGAALGAGAARRMVTAPGRTNIPRPIAQSKYLSPWTAPSFLPLSSSSSIPTQSPSAKAVCPVKRTTALRPSGSRMVCPTAISDMISRCWASGG